MAAVCFDILVPMTMNYWITENASILDKYQQLSIYRYVVAVGQIQEPESSIAINELEACSSIIYCIYYCISHRVSQLKLNR